MAPRSPTPARALCSIGTGPDFTNDGSTLSRAATGAIIVNAGAQTVFSNQDDGELINADAGTVLVNKSGASFVNQQGR